MKQLDNTSHLSGSVMKLLYNRGMYSFGYASGRRNEKGRGGFTLVRVCATVRFGSSALWGVHLSSGFGVLVWFPSLFYHNNVGEN
jgi:hypothetical protein